MRLMRLKFAVMTRARAGADLCCCPASCLPTARPPEPEEPSSGAAAAPQCPPPPPLRPTLTGALSTNHHLPLH